MSSHPSVPLFSVIVGINAYNSKRLNPAYKLRTLKGAVADAQSFKDWLEVERGVPSDQITFLTDEKATCSAIIDALTKLKTDIRIQRNDPIFIYYAGHGTEIKGPESWECGRADKMIQAIVPYDCDTVKSGQQVGPISDRTFGALIGNIAKEKGNNIFVVLDCCHSGSGTRGAKPGLDDDNRDTARAAELPDDYATALEQQLRDTGVHELTSPVRDGFIHYAMESHVLLSACKETEEAFETPVKNDPNTTKRGRFSMAILKLFYEMPIGKLSYVDILDHIAIPGQHPQCVGKHQARLIFDSKIPPARHRVFAVKYKEGTDGQTGQYILHAGTIQKVTPQCGFTLYNKLDVNLAHPLGTLAVEKISEFSSHAIVAPGDHDLRKFDIVAMRSKSGAKDVLKISITGDELLSIYKQLQHPDLEEVTLVKDLHSANVNIITSECKVWFTLYSLPHPNLLHPFQRFKWRRVVDIDLSKQAAELVPLLSKTAHFYRELKLANYNPDISSNVEVNFYKLKRLRDDNFEPVRDDNFCSNGVVTVSHDPDAMYGIELVNKTQHALYANIFYFSNKDLSIEPYVATELPGNFERDPDLQPYTGTFAIGWGAAGYDPLYCELAEGEENNVEFLKIYLSTEPVNLAYLRQTSPFEFSSDSPRGMKRYRRQQSKIWADLVIPIVQHRQSSNATPKSHN